MQGFDHLTEQEFKASSNRLLIIDDEQEILTVLKELLSSSGYQVETSHSPVEGLRKLGETAYSCIIADHFMPGMNGLELLVKAKELQPKASRILLTGRANLEMALDAINKGNLLRFITKPWETDGLLQAVKDGVSQFRLLVENQLLLHRTEELNEQLDAANKSLVDNFDRSLDLCRNLMSTHYPILGQNTQAVEKICQKICEFGALSEDECKILNVAATLHNIGLIGVPKDVISTLLRRPAQLSAEQQKIVEKHPVYGAFLAQFVGNLDGVAETIHAHHERWDGKGYPDGLAEEAIPRPALYLSVAAAYCENSYRHEDAVQYIMDQSDKAFSPEAVRVFLIISKSQKLPRKVRQVTKNSLAPGMILAASLKSPTGLLLIAEGQTLTTSMLETLRRNDLLSHIKGELLVYR